MRRVDNEAGYLKAARDLVSRLVQAVVDLQEAGHPEAGRLLKDTWEKGSFYFKMDLLGVVMRTGDAATVETVFGWAHGRDKIADYAVGMLTYMRDRHPELYERLKPKDPEFAYPPLPARPPVESLIFD